MRRRMNAPSSHLGMAVGPPPSERAIEGFSLPGESHMPGVPDDFTAQAWSRGDAAPAILSQDSAEFASAVSDSQATWPTGGRSHAVADESSGARLTVSPSMKIPTESPVPPYHQGRTVQSFRGRSFQGFNEGASEVYNG